MIYTLDLCDNKQFIFEFSSDEDENNTSECENLSSRYVNYKLFRKDKSQKPFSWKGCLSTSDENPFELTFPDEINIKGEMYLYKNQNDGSDYIFINVSYCYQLENHFEGNILKLPEK